MATNFSPVPSRSMIGIAAPSPASPLVAPVERIRRLIWKIALATLALMAVGSATRVMNAGLACPDWPLCYGQLVPQQQMNLQVFLEWFHRLDASLIGISTLWLLGLCLWYRQQIPGWLPWGAGGAVLLIGLQGALGGLTVTELLRFDIVTAHLGTALLFFSWLLAMGAWLWPYSGTGMGGNLRWLSLTAAILVYGQCLLGGLVGSRWAAHQCFGLAELCQVMNSHLVGVLPATIAVLTLTLSVWRTPALPMPLRRLGNLASTILAFQILLGIATFRLRLQVEPLTVAHHTLGAALLGVLVCFTALALRDRSLPHPTIDLTTPAASIPTATPAALTNPQGSSLA